MESDISMRCEHDHLAPVAYNTRPFTLSSGHRARVRACGGKLAGHRSYASKILMQKCRAGSRGSIAAPGVVLAFARKLGIWPVPALALAEEPAAALPLPACCAAAPALCLGFGSFDPVLAAEGGKGGAGGAAAALDPPCAGLSPAAAAAFEAAACAEVLLCCRGWLLELAALLWPPVLGPASSNRSSLLSGEHNTNKEIKTHHGMDGSTTNNWKGPDVDPTSLLGGWMCADTHEAHTKPERQPSCQP